MNRFRELGRSCITFRDLGSISKIIIGSTRKYVKRELRKFGHYFQGARGTTLHKSTLHPQGANSLCIKSHKKDINK